MSQPPWQRLARRIADAAHADDAERAAGQVLAQMAQRFPGLPFACLGVVVPLDDAARGAK